MVPAVYMSCLPTVVVKQSLSTISYINYLVNHSPPVSIVLPHVRYLICPPCVSLTLCLTAYQSQSLPKIIIIYPCAKSCLRDYSNNLSMRQIVSAETILIINFIHAPNRAWGDYSNNLSMRQIVPGETILIINFIHAPNRVRRGYSNNVSMRQTVSGETILSICSVQGSHVHTCVSRSL